MTGTATTAERSATFVERYGGAVGAGTTVLVTGDARTNLRGSGVESLRVIRHRCRRLYWFNPEPAAEWDDPDSALAEYRELCDGVFEVRNLPSSHAAAILPSRGDHERWRPNRTIAVELRTPVR